VALPGAPLADCGAPPAGRAVWLRASDGIRLRAAHWPGQRGTVLLLPGRTEYIEKYGLVVSDLAREGWGALVIDWRGQGLSDRLAEDPALGHVGTFADYQRDLAALLEAAQTLATGPMPVIAHSMGGCIALRAMCDGLRPPAAAFSAPMWGLAQTRTMRMGIAAMARLARPMRRDHGYLPTTGPEYGLPSMEFSDNPLTRDLAQFTRMQAQIRENPALALGGPSLRWGGAALSEMAALARLPAPPVRAVIGLGDNERIVNPQAIRLRVKDWPQAELIDYPQAEHELLMESPRVRTDFLRRVLELFNES